MVEIIRAAAEEKGLSISFIERYLNFGNGTIRRWDTSAPSADRLKKVCDLLNIDMNKLMEVKK